MVGSCPAGATSAARSVVVLSGCRRPSGWGPAGEGVVEAGGGPTAVHKYVAARDETRECFGSRDLRHWGRAQKSDSVGMQSECNPGGCKLWPRVKRTYTTSQTTSRIE